MGRKKKEDSSNEELKIAKPKAIGPYDIIKMIFTDKESFNKLSNLMLAKNFFMINRIFAIQFPLQAQFFNKLTMNEADVIKCWAQFAVSKLGYGRVPSFVFTKGGKKTMEEQNDGISKELKEAYCKHFQISINDFNDMLYFNHEQTIQHINNFEKITNVSELNKQIKKEK